MSDRLRDVVQRVIDRLQLDIDDGERPDQWSMEWMRDELRAALAEKLVPLTDEQLVDIEMKLRRYVSHDRYDLSLAEFARAVERAHGIGGEDET